MYLFSVRKEAHRSHVYELLLSLSKRLKEKYKTRCYLFISTRCGLARVDLNCSIVARVGDFTIDDIQVQCSGNYGSEIGLQSSLTDPNTLSLQAHLPLQ